MITSSQFEDFYRTHYTRLYYYAYDFVDNIENCKDLVGDVFATVWNDRDHINPETLSAYLYTAVRNRCLNYLRSRRYDEDYRNFCIEADRLSAQMPPDSDDERYCAINREIEKLPPRTRFVLEQCYLHNKKYKEVAEVLDISADGVKKHIVKAFATLRAHFNVNKE